MGLRDLRSRTLTVVVSVIGAVGFALQGYDQAVANGLLTLKSFTRTFPAIDTVNTTGAVKSRNSTIQGTTVAIYEVGCAMGALSCTGLGDRLGQLPFTLGQLIAARVITGLGVGGFTATIPMYIAENTPAKIRGRMVLLGGFFAIGGIVLASWLEFGLWCVENNSVSWRFPIAFQAIFALAITSLILFIPESPRWLVQRSRNEEAARVLAQLEDVDGDDFRVAVGFNTIRHSLQQEDEAGESGNPFARNETRNLHRTCLAVGVNLLAQMSGVNIITFYGCVGYCEGEDRGAC